MQQLFINTDGGSRGNPGPAAIGIIFYNSDEKVLHSHKQCIGVATNNEAEYQAIIHALKLLKENDWVDQAVRKQIICRLDSLLVVEQVNGNWKIKQPHIAKFIAEIRSLLENLNMPISFVHIPREKNKMADKLVNEALDEAKIAE